MQLSVAQPMPRVAKGMLHQLSGFPSVSGLHFLANNNARFRRRPRALGLVEGGRQRGGKNCSINSALINPALIEQFCAAN